MSREYPHVHYSDVIMSMVGLVASQITGVWIVCSIVCLGADKKSKLRVTGVCEGYPTVTSDSPSHRASNAENVSIWGHHALLLVLLYCYINRSGFTWCIYQHSSGLLAIGPSATHYNDVITDSMASQITSLSIVYSAVYSDADPRKHQSSASLAFVRGIHQMFPFDDVIMQSQSEGCR